MTQEAGFVDRDGQGLGVLAADLDGDRRIDLFVANDGTANTFHRNLGGFRFEGRSDGGRARRERRGGFQAGMGIAGGDVDGDGRLDLVVTNFYGESTTLFQSIGPGLYGDFSSRRSGYGRRRATAWGSAPSWRISTTTAGSTSPPPTATSTTLGR
ncbi:MAG: VCBS repeat-containing protein [Isosphaeraceae bacterium]